MVVERRQSKTRLGFTCVVLFCLLLSAGCSTMGNAPTSLATAEIKVAPTADVVLVVPTEIAAGTPNPTQMPLEPFDGERALEHAAFQVNLGTRLPNSQAHANTVQYISQNLDQAGWQVRLQETHSPEQPDGYLVRNVIGQYGSGRPWLVLGAHYDSRLVADKETDPVMAAQGVPGANDGASGVAVLLELARILPAYMEAPSQSDAMRFGQIWLVFFDAEDNGKLPGWDWILGSRVFVEDLHEMPDAVVILDMIGDADLKILQEKNSDPLLVKEIWDTAAELGYQEWFIPEPGPGILDDHTPFLQAGVPAVDIIDFSYPYWHTSQDTLDKLSAQSLRIVGETVMRWILK